MLTIYLNFISQSDCNLSNWGTEKPESVLAGVKQRTGSEYGTLQGQGRRPDVRRSHTVIVDAILRRQEWCIFIRFLFIVGRLSLLFVWLTTGATWRTRQDRGRSAANLIQPQQQHNKSLAKINDCLLKGLFTIINIFTSVQNVSFPDPLTPVPKVCNKNVDFII